MPDEAEEASPTVVRSTGAPMRGGRGLGLCSQGPAATPLWVHSLESMKPTGRHVPGHGRGFRTPGPSILTPGLPTWPSFPSCGLSVFSFLVYDNYNEEHLVVTCLPPCPHLLPGLTMNCLVRTHCLFWSCGPSPAQPTDGCGMTAHGDGMGFLYLDDQSALWLQSVKTAQLRKHTKNH